MNLFTDLKDHTTILWSSCLQEQQTRALCMLLQLASYDYNFYTSQSFQISAATLAAAAGLPAWLKKANISGANNMCDHNMYVKTKNYVLRP